MRALAVLLAALALAGCGAGNREPAAEPEGAPPDPPEQPQTGPPPAWLEGDQGSRWLAYSTYCWSGDGEGLCADYVGPSCKGEHPAPEIRAHRGERLTVHLGFDPTEVGLVFLEAGGEPLALETAREVSWTADRAGPFAVFARVEGGDASYVGCLVLE